MLKSNNKKELNLSEIEKKVAWLSNYIIHNANNLRNKDDELKVGGHQASCASVISILVVLYFKILNKNQVNHTIGLKINRFSPAHGTARDIKYKNKANINSFIQCMIT